ncbi:MAG: kinase [Dokdonella sp.]
MRSDASTQVGYDPTVVTVVLDWLLAGLCSRRRTVSLIGLTGLQGSGKSTFARQLARAANARGVATEVLALDDFYLGRRERVRLAREVHPLLATRGVPGTHDLDLLRRTLRELARANAQRPARIPRFDKGRDTRLPPSRWRPVAISPRLVLLEGWCVGVPAQATNALARPLNDLERDEDSDGRWRRWVNRQLADGYTRLWRQMHGLILLEAPDFAVVSDWRNEPERTLRAGGAPCAMDRAALRRFVMHYERLSRHALRALPARADLRILLRDDRSVRRLLARA